MGSGLQRLGAPAFRAHHEAVYCVYWRGLNASQAADCASVCFLSALAVNHLGSVHRTLAQGRVRVEAASNTAERVWGDRPFRMFLYRGLG